MAYENLNPSQSSEVVIANYLAIEAFAEKHNIAEELGSLVVQARDTFEPDPYINSGTDRWLGFIAWVGQSIPTVDTPEELVEIAVSYLQEPVRPADFELKRKELCSDAY